MMLDGHTYINIDAQHIKASSPRLLAATVESPEDMVLLWDEAVNRLAREQSDLLSEMGLQAPEDTIQVGNTFAVSGFFVCFCTDMCVTLPSDVGGITKQQCDSPDGVGLQAPEDTVQVGCCCLSWILPVCLANF
jgi:hypothetical protein